MSRQVDYTGRDFDSLKNQLEEFSKQYFPNSFNNFNDYSPETALMEMMAYVGDSLNFNIDDKFRQNFLQYSDQIESVFRLAKEKGYRPQTVAVALGNVEFSQIVPATLSGSVYVPDDSYAGIIQDGTQVSNFDNNTYYELNGSVDMSDYSRSQIVQTGSSGEPTQFRIYKSGEVHSGKRKTKQINVNSFEKNLELFVDQNVAYIESIEDSNGNDWFEVQYMAQDTIFEGVENESQNSTFEPYKNETPYLLRARRVSRRFIVDHKSNGDCYIQFGEGTDIVDEDLKGLSTEDFLTTNDISNYQLNNTFVVDNFLKNDSMGLVPNNTTLTITYVIGRGEEDNSKANTINNLVNPVITFPNNQNSTVTNSFLVNNNEPISGASFLNSMERIRNQATEAYVSQNRCVTIRDYIIRAKTLPNKYGNVDKVFAEKNINYKDIERNGQESKNRSSINMYVLAKDDEGNLIECNVATKNNLRVYLNEFRMATDTINIRDPYIVNIGVKYNFVAKKDFNKDQVAINIDRQIEDFFDIDKWQINQPIVLEDLRYAMLQANGVASVSNIRFENKYNENSGYSGVYYDVSIGGNNFDENRGVLYPPADISIFEMKYPLKDITSKAI